MISLECNQYLYQHHFKESSTHWALFSFFNYSRNKRENHIYEHFFKMITWINWTSTIHACMLVMFQSETNAALAWCQVPSTVICLFCEIFVWKLLVLDTSICQVLFLHSHTYKHIIYVYVYILCLILFLGIFPLFEIHRFCSPFTHHFHISICR